MSSPSERATDPPHILVVSDLDMVLWALTESLATAGYVVTGCPSMWRARKLASSGHFDLAVLDVPTNEVAARELVAFVRASGMQIKLLALVSTHTVMSRTPLNVDHIALKPPRADELLESVARLLGLPSAPSAPDGRRPKAG